MTEPSPLPAGSAPSPRWQPLSAIDRRVVGVLVEKAKTTPATYPMSLNAVVTGCNQKSNRFPVMSLEPDDVEESLDRLRNLGAVGLVQGVGRVSKYRHYMYDWLGVDKVEIAVMAELLLRGTQTEGDLRARASRMEPIADLTALRPILASLKTKGLVLPLTPEGRGHVVTHALYPPRELERIHAEFTSGRAVLAPSEEAEEEGPSRHVAPAASPAPPAPAPAAGGQSRGAIERELQELRALVAEMREDLSQLAAQFEQAQEEFRRLRDSLGA